MHWTLPHLHHSSPKVDSFTSIIVPHTCRRFLKDVHWGACDYLVIDSPPGTSDEHISIVQVGAGLGMLASGRWFPNKNHQGCADICSRWVLG